MIGSRLAILFGALLLALSGTAWATPDEHTRLGRGEIITESHAVPGSGIPEITVRAVINAPPERVWPIIDHCGDYARTMVHAKSSRELSRVGNVVRCELVVDMPWPFPNLRGVSVAVHTVEPGRWERTWKGESGDYKVNTGHWLLTPWDNGRTLAEYRMHTEPKVALPDFLLDFAARTAVPSVMDKLREDVK